MGEEICKNCRSWEEEIYWTHFQCIHFSQFLHAGFDQRLELPEKFTRKLKMKLPEVVSLKSPSGITWEVGLTTYDNSLFFNHGWEDFVKNHLLEENDFLIFKYNGESQFDVLIFDGQSMCEKAASYFVKSRGQRGDQSRCQKKRRTGASLEDDKTDIGPRSLSGKVLHSTRCGSSKRAVTEEDKENALQLAEAALGDNGFIIVMKPSHVIKKYFVSIPSPWVHKHLSPEKQDLILRFKEKTWRIKYLYRTDRNRGAFAGGWKKFVLDNNLHEFDVCLFQPGSLVKNSIILDVNIFRAMR